MGGVTLSLRGGNFGVGFAIGFGTAAAFQAYSDLPFHYSEWSIREQDQGMSHDHCVPYTITSTLVESELPSIAACMSNFLPGDE